MPRTPQNWFASLVLGLGVLAAGCPTTTGGSAEYTPDAGPPNDAGVWSSAASWSSGFFPIASDQTLTIHHGLGRTPALVQVYVSFGESPVYFTLASGNMAEINVVDATQVVIHNHTGTNYWYKLVLF